MRPEDLAEIDAAMAAAGVARLELTGPSYRLVLARRAAAVTAAPESEADPDADPSVIPVPAPAIGIFPTAPAPTCSRSPMANRNSRSGQATRWRRARARCMSPTRCARPSRRGRKFRPDNPLALNTAKFIASRHNGCLCELAFIHHLECPPP